jgi:hypothetical protein
MPSPAQINALRQLLAERFPSVQRTTGRVLPTGLAAIDEPAGGGLPLGAVTEFVCVAPSCGGHLLLGQLLAATRAQRLRAALIDATDAFEPASFPVDDLAHLVWVRGNGDVATALAATDLLARDANLGLVVLDLRYAPATGLRRTPPTLWYRLQRAVENTDLALVIETPRALVASAQLRFELNRSLAFEALECERPELTTRLAPVLGRQRLIAAATA